MLWGDATFTPTRGFLPPADPLLRFPEPFGAWEEIARTLPKLLVGGRPRPFRGETGAQSSITPALDAFLGIAHRSDPLHAYLLEMRDCMPPAHRDFVAALEAGSPVRVLVRRWRAGRPELRRAYNRCVRLLHRFRTIHVGFAARYVQEQSQKSAANPTGVGTGGTPFMRYLEKHRRETEEHLL